MQSGARFYAAKPERTQMFRKATIFALAIGVSALAAAGAQARSRQVCGWYVIAGCFGDRDAAGDMASKGWGAIIDTDDYEGFEPGHFCVVSGPQPKSSAIRDRRNSIADGVSPDAYIKRACTDPRNVGD
jgi:hypothetical protein